MRPRKALPSAARLSEPRDVLIARSLLARGKYEEGLRAFAELARTHRADPRILIEAARAFAARFRLEKADTFLVRALRLGTRRFDVQLLAGEYYRAQGRFAEAEACFRRAMALADHAPQAQLELAYICERTHRLEPAEALCREILGRYPQHGGAYILLARILRRRGEAVSAEASLTDWLNRNPESPAAPEGWGELTTLLDEQGRYADAWQAATRGKEIQRRHSDREWMAAQHVAKRFAEVGRQFSAELAQRWRNVRFAPEPSPRLAFLTGFPRSGTTLLENVLDAHSDIVSMEERDVLAGEVFPFLSRGSHTSPVIELLDNAPHDDLMEARRRYFSYADCCAPRTSPGQWLLDKNPALTLMIPAITRLFPEAKLLFVQRDPRDILVSCFLRHLPLNPVSVCFLTPERILDRYELDMHAWLRFREVLPDGWCQVRYEDLLTDIAQAARPCIELLGCAWQQGMQHANVRARQRVVLSPTYEAVAQPVYLTARGRWKNYEPFLEGLRPRLDALASTLGDAPKEMMERGNTS